MSQKHVIMCFKEKLPIEICINIAEFATSLYSTIKGPPPLMD